MSNNKIRQIKLPDETVYEVALPAGDKDATYYTTASATANAFTVTIPGITELTDGMIIHVKFNAATASGATLNVNSLGAKAIYYREATAITTHIVKNNYVTLIYEASTGHWVMQFAYDSAGSNTIGYQIRTNSSLWANKTGYAMNRYTLLFEVDGGLSGAATTIGTGTTKVTVPFKYIPGGVIKYYSTSGSIAKDANFGATGLWDQYVINLGYTFNTGSTLTSGKPVYMRCSINTDGTLTPNYAGSPSHPITQTLPTTEDGYVYVFLGQAYSTTNIELCINHPIYQYKDGKICLYSAADIDTGATSIETTGSGNVVNSATYDAATRKITLSKGITALTAHQSIKTLKTDNTTTQTASLSEAIAGSGTINLHKVSKTGSYNDLLDKPTIPTDTNQKVKAGTVTFDANDTVNFEGSGIVSVTGDATNDKITISASHQSVKTLKTDNTTAQTASSSEAITGSGTINLHKIAKTGTYSDLIGKPSIPDSDSDLTNDRYVRYDTNSQGLTDTQKSNARTNIGAGTYSKPSTGIPAGDLDAATRATLVKASNLTVSATNGVSDGTNTYKYTHPSYSTQTAGLYKIGRDSTGHVTIGDAFTIPTVNNATLTIQKNGTTVNTFTANASSNVTANITVPTKVSELTNDSGYTTNTGTVTSVSAGTGLSISGTASVNPTVNVASSYKLPTTTEWNNTIKDNDILIPTSGFAYVYNGQLDDTMWQFGKRYYIVVSVHPITVNGVTYPHTDSTKESTDDNYIVDSTPIFTYNSIDNPGNVDSFFDGSVDTSPIQTTSNNYIKVKIIPFATAQTSYSPSASTTQFPGYPYGVITMHTYWGANASAVRYACYNKYTGQGVGWKIINGTKVNNDNQTWKITDGSNYSRTEIDFWFIGDGDSSHTLRPTAIYWIRDRVTNISDENSYVSKYVDEELVTNLKWSSHGTQTAKITASTGTGEFTTLYEGGNSLSAKYLGKSAKAADSDKLDGQDSTYYLNYNNLTNKPTIPVDSNLVHKTGDETINGTKTFSSIYLGSSGSLTTGGSTGLYISGSDHTIYGHNGSNNTFKLYAEQSILTLGSERTDIGGNGNNTKYGLSNIVRTVKPIGTTTLTVYTYTYPNDSGTFALTNDVPTNLENGSGENSLQQKGTTAGYDSQTTLGTYNNNKSDTLLEVGNGTSSSPSNALEVYADGHVEVGAESAIGADTFTITVTSSGSYPVDHASYGVTDLPVSKFEALYNYINNNGSKTVSESSSYSSTIISVSWTATTRTFDGVTYNAINCNAGGPGYYLYKYSDTEVRMSSAAVSLMTALTVYKAGTDSGVMNILSPNNTMGVVTVGQFVNILDSRGYTTASEVNNYRYKHTVRVYLANKIQLRCEYIISKTQSSDYASVAPNSQVYLARALYYAGATSQNIAVPATGMVYVNANTTGIVTGIYSTGTVGSNIYICYLPIVTSSGSDATIAVNVPSESTVQLISVGSPTVVAYAKAV